jgi:hypothetical protein
VPESAKGNRGAASEKLAVYENQPFPPGTTRMQDRFGPNPQVPRQAVFWARHARDVSAFPLPGDLDRVLLHGRTPTAHVVWALESYERANSGCFDDRFSASNLDLDDGPGGKGKRKGGRATTSQSKGAKRTLRARRGTTGAPQSAEPTGTGVSGSQKRKGGLTTPPDKTKKARPGPIEATPPSRSSAMDDLEFEKLHNWAREAVEGEGKSVDRFAHLVSQVVARLTGPGRPEVGGCTRREWNQLADRAFDFLEGGVGPGLEGAQLHFFELCASVLLPVAAR